MQSENRSYSPVRYLSLVTLVVANLLPIAGVFYFDWEVAALMILYWSENLVLGFYTILRMLVVSPVGGLFASLFFVMHYGGFCAVHGLFIAALLLDLNPDTMGMSSDWPFAFIFLEILYDVIRAVLQVAPPEWLWGFLALLVSHGVSFLQNFLFGGERHQLAVSRLMGAPYARMMVLHVAMILGGFAVVSLGQSLWMLLALVALKLGLDITLHLREHRKMRDMPVQVD